MYDILKLSPFQEDAKMGTTAFRFFSEEVHGRVDLKIRI
jgi:hypothetical protein